MNILNTGLLTLLNGGSSNAAISNAGTLDVAGGSFTVSAAWALAGTVSVEVGATLSLTTGSNNSGSLNILGTLTAGGTFTNSGSVNLSGAFTVTAGGSYTQTTGGSTTLNGGSLTAAALNLQGGILAGAGTITGDVTNAAEIDVGGVGSAGLLAIMGNYTQTAAGVLNLEVGGYGAGVGFDQLTVSGTATLGGTMNVSLLNGFVPMSGDAFALLTFASATGTSRAAPSTRRSWRRATTRWT